MLHASFTPPGLSDSCQIAFCYDSYVAQHVTCCTWTHLVCCVEENPKRAFSLHNDPGNRRSLSLGFPTTPKFANPKRAFSLHNDPGNRSLSLGFPTTPKFANPKHYAVCHSQIHNVSNSVWAVLSIIQQFTQMYITYHYQLSASGICREVQINDEHVWLNY